MARRECPPVVISDPADERLPAPAPVRDRPEDRGPEGYARSVSEGVLIKNPVSHSSPHTTRVLEQRNLLGGADLVTQITRGNRTEQRTLHVDGRWKVGFAAALALVVGHGRKEGGEPVPSMTRCPRCGLMGRTDEDFGTRVVRGKRRTQSWCRSCRSSHAPSSTASSTGPVQFEWGFAR